MNPKWTGVGVCGLLLVGLATVAQAQGVIPHSYRVTRTAPSQTPAPDPVVFTFLRSEMTCFLSPAPLPSVGVRFADPANPRERQCQLLGAGNWSGLPPGVLYRFGIVGCTEAGACGPEVFIEDGVPGGVDGFQLRPSYTGVSVAGTVAAPPYAFLGLEVAPITLDHGMGQLLLAATRLSVPGYSVLAGHRVTLRMHPPQ